MLVVGLLITLVASVFCSLAPSAALLIAARVGQGVGGALVVPSSLALLNGTLRPEDRARGIGIWAGLSTLGTTIGPYAGGWLVDQASWRWLFILNVPLVLAAIGCLVRVPESRDLVDRGRPDATGAVFAAAGVGGVIYALTDGAGNGWGSPAVLLSGIVGLACLLVLVPYERRQPNPVLQVAVFASRQFDAINASTLLFYGALSGAGFLLTLQLELQLGFSPTMAGAALIPSSAVFLAISPFSGALVARYGPRRLMAVGIFLVGVANAWLAFAAPGSSYWTAVLPPVLLQGIGLGLAVTPLTAAVLAAVQPSYLGEASAINNAVSRLGGVVAIAVLPAVAGATRGRSLADTLADSYRPGMLITGVLCLLAAVIAAWLVSDEPCAAPRLSPPPPHGSMAHPLDRVTAD
jgi:EmrB/QacA subfamily drug resistance transporter